MMLMSNPLCIPADPAVDLLPLLLTAAQNESGTPSSSTRQHLMESCRFQGLRRFLKASTEKGFPGQESKSPADFAVTR